MGNDNKKNVQLVISHLEGCSGNFLGRLYADTLPPSFFRIDTNDNSVVLATNGRENFDIELTRLKNHRVVVTHLFDLNILRGTFPNAKIIQIYPYTHIGNVLYNICFKKLHTKNNDASSSTVVNLIDIYIIQLKVWHAIIENARPEYQCVNYWELSQKDQIERILELELNNQQKYFFDSYWKEQLPYQLSMPTKPTSIYELIKEWGIQNYFCPWAVAWTIFVFEHVNQLSEASRTWSIDQVEFNSWQDVENIQFRYSNNLTNSSN